MTVSARPRNRKSSPLTRDLARRASLGRLGADAAPPFLDAWLALWTRDPDGIADVYAADAVWEDVAAGLIVQGREQIRAYILASNEEERAVFPDHQREVRSAFAAGGRAAVEIAFSATHTGTYPGLPSGGGQPVAMRGVVIFELDGDTIRHESHYYDVNSLLAQLGAPPPPGAEETPVP